MGKCAKLRITESKLMSDTHSATEKSKTVSFLAEEPWHDTKYVLEAGRTYRIGNVTAVPPLKDWFIPANPDGIEPAHAWKMNWLRFGLRLKTAKSLTDGNQVRVTFFTLLGCIGQDENTAFVIGSKGGLLNVASDVEKGRTMHVFVNDWRGMYKNNEGGLSFTIEAVG
jgi:hypothetical protein